MISGGSGKHSSKVQAAANIAAAVGPMISKPGYSGGGKVGMAAAAGPMIAGMMSGHPPKPGYPAQPLGHPGQQSSSGGFGGMASTGTMAAIGGIAAAGLGYYGAMQAKKASKKGMSYDAYLGGSGSKKYKKLAKKAMKYGMTPEQYLGKRGDRYNAKMTNLYGPFTGTLPAAMMMGKMHKKGKKHKKAKKYGGGSSESGSSDSSGSSGGDSDGSDSDGSD